MGAKMYLFVGGSLDGARRRINADVTRQGYVAHPVPVHSRDHIPSFRIEQYRLERIQEGRVTWEFFIIDTMPSPVAALLAGYRQPRKVGYEHGKEVQGEEGTEEGEAQADQGEAAE
jgi:hypothetical protein